MIIGLWIPKDEVPYIARLREIIGPHAIKMSTTPESYLSSIAAKVRTNNIDTIIVSCPQTMTVLLTALTDFRHPLDKRGLKRKLSPDDYAGSFFTIDAAKLGTDKDVDVLVINPIAQLVSVPHGKFVTQKFISKITQPDSWMHQTPFTWEVWKPSTSAALLSKFSSALLLAIDIETYRDDPKRRIHCVGYCGLFADGSTHTVVVPFKDMLAHQFVRQLNSSPAKKVFQNGLYDNLYFLRFNVPCENWLYDTLHLAHSWYSELPKRLDFISAFCVRRIRYWKDDAAGGEHNLFEYNARDCWATLTSAVVLLLGLPSWGRDNYIMEFPLVFPCIHMEADGLTVDSNKFEAAKKEVQAKLDGHRSRLAAWFGDTFNPGSSDQCKRLLTVLGVKNVEAADSKALVACAAVHPLNELIVSEILAYRKQAKLLSTYFVWDKFWNDRLYYKTNPAGTDSGRLASTESSFWTGLQIQNIPQGKAVKSWIKCDDGWDGFAEGDYAQSEARCVGYMSGCTALIELVESDKDYHSWNAHKFFGVPYEQVDKALRNLSKRVNHGSNYNMGAGVLLDTMGPKAVAEAKILLKLPAKWTLTQVCDHLLRTYANTYPEVKRDWYDDIKRTIKLTKKLVSPLGWTRYFFSDPTKSKQALNSAVAHGPQNLSVTIINRAFYRVWRESLYGSLLGKVRLKAQIHDSLFFAYRGEETRDIVREMMKEPIQVKGVDNVTRTMLIPPDMSDGGRYWADIK